MSDYRFPPVEEPAKPKRKKWPWITGGVVGGVLLIGALAPGEEPAQAEPVVTTVTATATTTATTTVKPTPTTTTSAPPTTTDAPEPEPVIVEDEDANVAPAPFMAPAPQPEADNPPVRQAAPEPVVQAPPPPPPPVAPEPAPRSAYYANCTEAKAAGAAPMYEGSPGYRSALDKDKDGIACDK